VVMQLGDAPADLQVLADGRTVAVAVGKDVEIWDSKTGLQTAKLTGHTATIASISADAQGKRLLTSAWDGTARVWDVATRASVLVVTASSAVAPPPPDGKPEDRKGIVGSVVAAIIKARPGNAAATALVTSSLSADGLYIATANADNHVRVFDANTGSVIHDFEATGCGQLRCAPSLAIISPDGKTLLSNNSDSTGTITDIPTGKQTPIVAGPTGFILSAAFSSDSRTFVTGSQDGTTRVWSIDGRRIAEATGHSTEISAVSFSLDGRRFVTGARDNARVWDAETGKQLAVFERQKGMVRTALFVADGSAVVTTSDDATAVVWNTITGQQVATLAGHATNLKTARFLPGGTAVLTVGADRTARVWQFREGPTAIRKYPGPTQKIDQAQYSRNGELIAAISQDGFVRIWDVKTGKLVEQIANTTKSWNGVDFSPDGKLLAFSSGKAEVRVWDIEKRAIVQELKGHDGTIIRFGFLDDGKTLLTLSSDATAIIWELGSPRPLRRLAGHGGPVNELVVRPDRIVTGHTTALLGNRGEDLALLWDRADGKIVATLSGHGAPISMIRGLLDTDYVLTGAQNGTLRVWSVVDGSLVMSLEGHKTAIRVVRSSKKKKRLVTTASDGTTYLWNTNDWTRIAELKVSKGSPQAIHLLSDDTRILVAQGKGPTPIFDIETGREILQLDGETPAIGASAINHDGSIVVTSSYVDKSIYFWDGKTGVLLDGMQMAGGYALSITASPDGLGVLVRSGDGLKGPDVLHQLSFVPWPLSGERLLTTARASVSRCLSVQQRAQAFLDRDPPDWCITGANAAAEQEPDQWKPLWPLQAEANKGWLIKKRFLLKSIQPGGKPQ
jgi:WD40 repeat protein